MKKRGFVEIQANWAFAVIIGMMLLLFFAGVVKKQIERNSFEESLRAATFMSKTVAGGKAYSEIELPKEQIIGVSCDEEELTVGGMPAKWSTGVIAFGPKSMKMKRLSLLRFDEKMPFLYAGAAVIMPKGMKIILAQDGFSNNTANAIIEVFSPTISALKPEDFGINASVLAIVIDKDGQPARAVAFGQKVVFLEPDNDGLMINVGEAPYFDENLAIAAIASDFEGYSCGAEKLARRIGVVSESFLGKAQKLQSSECNYPINELEIMKGNSTIEQLGILAEAAKSVEAQNNLLAETSCEVLY
ncbi:MAG: hypothetical protein V1702_03095 [Candidatus Woesearchaeota archaeon]